VTIDRRAAGPGHCPVPATLHDVRASSRSPCGIAGDVDRQPPRGLRVRRLTGFWRHCSVFKKLPRGVRRLLSGRGLDQTPTHEDRRESPGRM
jgi:hypothetical protein